eukprot:NODE_3414_length_777_cov_163.517857_g2853_i0.p1 GENE.NODE_3414_length_777_cov_163.517857_g2853_i0~~NODE_3414_length_777_cov_163.517857_g2853_i0.p1  ORF type:complete len:126 (+),score=27.50 NODE_3414_length_777_cov_163.517857_g2853_i0:330-707(+)
MLSGEKEVDYSWVVVDVRRPLVMNEGTLRDALLLPYFTAENATFLLEPLAKKYDKVIVHCYIGWTQMEIVRKMNDEMGYQNVVGVKDGYLGVMQAAEERQLVEARPRTWASLMMQQHMKHGWWFG